MAIIIGDTDDNDVTGTVDPDQISGGDGDDVLEGGAGADTLDGGAGFDAVSYEHSSAGVNVNLTLGGIGSDADGDVIISVEDLIGSAFGDVLAGNAGANLIFGGGGGDLIEGMDGDDVINGGEGSNLLVGGDGHDLLDYTDAVIAPGALYGVILDFTSRYANVYRSSVFLPDRDTFSGFEGALGSEHADWFRGGAGDDMLVGLGGDDLLSGGAGADFLVGADGIDTASYADASSAVDVSLFDGLGYSGEAENDVLVSIENLVGSSHNDTLEGNDGDNLIAGGAGADTLNGLDGFDTLDYRSSAAAVFVNLSQSRSSGGDAQGDVFSSFEGVIGSARRDRLHGGNGNQTIEGFSGNDQMHGGNGIDTLSFEHSVAEIHVDLVLGFATGAGNDTISGFENVITSSMSDIIIGDTNDNILEGMGGGDGLDGGDGFDTASYSRSDAAVIVNLATGAASGGHAQGDVLENIEGLIGSAFDDNLTGSDGDDRIEGGIGSDTMDGGDGVDTLSYIHAQTGVGVNLALGETCGCNGEIDVLVNFENITGSAFDDVLTGDALANVLIGGAGADVLDGGGGDDSISYAGAASRVIVNLNTGVGQLGEADGDQYISIERVVGTNFNDRIYGGLASETFEGGLGNDWLYGRRGDDTLTGGAGNDHLNGGAGADHFVFGDEVGHDVIEDYLVTADIIVLDANIFADFADVMASTTNDGSGNSTISKGGLQITLTGVTREQLVSGGFDFQASSSSSASEAPEMLTMRMSGFDRGPGMDGSPGPTVPPVPQLGLHDLAAFDGAGLHAAPVIQHLSDWII